MPAAYFHIDEVSRDAVVASSLKRKLADLGIELAYGNRVSSPLLRRTDPYDLYIFPSIDLFRSFFPDLGALRTPVMILPAESVGGLTNNLRRLGAKYFGTFPEECREWTARVGAFCLWGPSHSKSFEAFGPHLLDKVHVVGHPRFDESCTGRRPRKNATPKIGLLSRFSGLNPFDGASILQNVFSGRRSYYRDGAVSPRFAVHADRDWEDYLYNELVDLRLLFEVAEALSARGADLELRVHPRENRREWASLIERFGLPLRIAPWDMPFQHWAAGVDQVIGPTSTSFFDCFAIGHRPICTNALAPKRAAHVIAGGDDDNPILEFVHMPSSMGSLVELATAPPAGAAEPYPPGLARILREEAWYPDCANSLDRIARICADLVADGSAATKTGPRLLHAALVQAANANQVLRHGWHPAREQSSSFLITPARRRWIDGLSSAVGPAPALLKDARA